jgi:hypothetical protein
VCIWLFNVFCSYINCYSSVLRGTFICGSCVFYFKVRQIDSFVKKLYFSYSNWKLVIKTNLSHLTLHSTLVSRDCITGMTENRRQCRLQYPCNGASRRIITMIAIFVWSALPVTKKNKKGINIRISYQLYSPFLMDLTYQYLVHLITWVTNLKAVPCNWTLKKCISSHINMTDQ